MGLALTKELSSRLEEASSEWALPLDFLRAINWVESAGNVNALRYEPNYRWLYDTRSDMPMIVREQNAPGVTGPGAISRWTEYIGQKTSWGPMQVMGAVAREYKFRGYFPALCSTSKGVYYGCKHLEVLQHRFRIKKGDLVSLATAYNTGSPKDESHPYWKKVALAMERDNQ